MLSKAQNSGKVRQSSVKEQKLNVRATHLAQLQIPLNFPHLNSSPCSANLAPRPVQAERNKKSRTGPSGGGTNGLASSLAFTPVQGIELVNPTANKVLPPTQPRARSFAPHHPLVPMLSFSPASAASCPFHYHPLFSHQQPASRLRIACPCPPDCPRAARHNPLLTPHHHLSETSPYCLAQPRRMPRREPKPTSPRRQPSSSPPFDPEPAARARAQTIPPHSTQLLPADSRVCGGVEGMQYLKLPPHARRFSVLGSVTFTESDIDLIPLYCL